MDESKFYGKTSIALIAIIVMTAIIILILGLTYYNKEKEYATNNEYSKLRSIAELEASQIENWRKERIADIRILAKSSILANYETSLFNAQKKSDLKNEVLNRFKYETKVDNEYVNIIIASVDGEVKLAYNPSESDIDTSAKVLINLAAKKNLAVFGNVFNNKENGHALLDIAAPIKNDNYKIKYVLIYRIDLEKSLHPVIESWPGISQSAETVLLMKKGNYIINLSDNKHQHNSSLTMKLPLTKTENPAVQAVLGKRGILEGIDYKGDKVIGYAKFIENSPWFIISKVNRDELLSDVNYKTHTIIIVTFLLFIIVASFTLYIFNYRRKRFYKELYEDELELKALKAHFEYVVKYANDIILLEDENFNIIEANDRAVEAYQYNQNELRKLKVTDLTLPERKNIVKSKIVEGDHKGGSISEGIHKRKDGSTFYAEVSLRTIEIEGKKYHHQIIRDITERKIAELKIENANRVYAVISQINQAIVRLKNKNDLFNEVCKIAVDFGKFKLAWIGMIDDESNLMKLVSSAGIDDGYLESVKKISINEAPESEGPSARVIRHGKHFVCNDIKNDPIMLPWKDEALKRGFLSSIGIPIIHFGKNAGVFNLYASDSNFFDKEEIDLLIEVTNDISFALEAIESELKRKKAEEALIRSEEQLKLSQKVARLGYYIFDVASGIWTNSEMLDEIFGIDSDYKRDVTGWLGIIHPDDQLEMANYFSNYVIKEKNEFNKDYRVINKKNTKSYWVHGQGNLEYDKNGNPVKMFGTIQDITQQKLAEVELRESEERFRTVYNTAPEAIAISDINTGVLFEINEGYKKTFGFDLDEIKGKTALELGIWVNDQDRKKLTDDLHKFGKFTNKEISFKNKDGKIIHSIVSGRVIFINNIKYMLSVVNDITELYEIAQDLKESEERLRTTLYSIGDGVITTDEAGKVYQMNPIAEQLTGWKECEAKAKSMDDVFQIRNETTRNIVESPVQKVLTEGKIVGLANHTILISKDGKEIPIADSGAPIKSENGEMQGVVLVFRDQSKERETQLIIEKSLREKEVLLKEIHHRVKNNFQKIISLISLQAEMIEDQKILGIFEDLQSRLISMSLIHELMYSSGDFDGVDIKNYIEKLVSFLIKTYSTSNLIKLNMEIEQHDLDADSVIPCGLIINEIISNSLKYAFPNNSEGKINISFKKIRDEYNLVISDNGIGIKGKIDFESRKSLGLRLIDMLTRQLKGKLEVDQPERGLRFSIMFNK